MMELYNSRNYSTDLYKDRAIELIDEHSKSKDPMFMFLSFQAPHTPNQVTPKLLNCQIFVLEMVIPLGVVCMINIITSMQKHSKAVLSHMSKIMLTQKLLAERSKTGCKYIFVSTIKRYLYFIT